MNVGYYFHAPAAFDDDHHARIEAFFAAFVQALSATAGHATLYAHPGPPDETHTGALGPSCGVSCIALDRRRHAPLMYLWPRPSLRHFRPAVDGVDALVVRGPTPLLRAFARRCRRAGVPMVGLLVADHRNWRPSKAVPAWRNRLDQVYGYFLDRSIERASRHTLMLSISRSITTGRGYRRVDYVHTSSLTDADVLATAPRRQWPAHGSTRLLFAGRLVEEKGLLDLVAALRVLVDAGHDVVVELVGGLGDATVDHALRTAEQLGVRDRITLTGYLAAGPSLLEAYRRSDVYVLPTHGEGAVPHTVKEAAATRTPIVTTNVAAITEFFADRQHAVLVAPRDPAALARGIAAVIEDEQLRAAMIDRAFRWVQGHTVEASAAAVVEHLRAEARRIHGP